MQTEWDATLVSAGSFPDRESAEACVNAIFRANVDEILQFVESPRKRMRPLRMHFDEPVGLLEARDESPVQPRVAALLLHNDGGYPHVFNAYPELDRPGRPEWPGLEVLFGAYFHGDWIDDYGDPLDVVRDFATEAPAEDRAATLEELRRLQQTGEESDRREIVFALGSFFVPRPPGQLDAFLAEAIAVLEEAPEWTRHP